MMALQAQQPYDTISHAAQQSRDNRLQQKTFGVNLDSSAPVTHDFSNLSFITAPTGSPAQNPQANLSSMNTPRHNLSRSQPRTLATSTSTGIGSQADPADPNIISISSVTGGDSV
jgi:hypothetical protein